MTHFLAIQHESYDASTVYGVFDTFIEARDYLEAEALKPNGYYVMGAEIEEWEGATQIRSYDRRIFPRDIPVWDASDRIRP